MEHMNEDLIKRHNMVVNNDDHIWYLGDLSFGDYKQTAEILDQLNGIKHLIVGNHDRKGRAEKLFNRDWEKWFVEKHDYLRLKIGNYKFALCHFPFSSWERGYINLHGHLHNLAGYENKYLQYDVGADANNYTPLLMEDVIKKAEAGVKSVNFY